MDTDKIQMNISNLIDDWCDQRNLQALSQTLPGWPIGLGLTDDWAGLLEALKNVRAFAKDTLTVQQTEMIEDMIAEIERALHTL